MRVVVLDVETKATVDLKKTNAYTYARHPDTDVWMVCYAYDDDPENILTWWPDEPMPLDLETHVEGGGLVCCHNCSFEHAIWTEILSPRYGWAEVRIEQMDDTAARARRCGLPGRLELAAPAAGLEVLKDSKGATQMKRMAKPRRIEPDGTVIWWDEPDRVERLWRYCEQDVRTQMALHQTLPPLPPKEREIWQATFRANARGVKVDIPFVHKALEMVDLKMRAYAQELLTLTNGQVKSHTDLNGMKEFLRSHWVAVDSLDKNAVASLLQDDAVPVVAKRVLTIRAEAGKSSVAKFPTMKSHADGHAIMRDLLVYYGAIATGRWSGAGPQIQNYPARGEVGYRDAEALISAALAMLAPEINDLAELLHDGSAVETLSMCLRGAIVARPGMEVVCADYSNIEGRVGAWLGGEEWKLDAFRAYDNGTGPDLYKVTAGSILGKDPEDVDKTERNVMGKVPELALLFGGGVGAFDSMATIYGIDMNDYVGVVRENLGEELWAQATENYNTFGKDKAVRGFRSAWKASEAIKLAWRERHPGVKSSWHECGDSAVAAIRSPGKPYPACGGKLAFLAKYMFGKLFLLMRLPSGRCIHYANVRLQEKKTPWGATKLTISFDKVESGRIIRSYTHGGDIYQSATQGIARDLMAQGWLNVEYAGYIPLFSVHDELASEIQEGIAELRDYCLFLCEQEKWADGIPIAAEGYIGQRFRKD